MKKLIQHFTATNLTKLFAVASLLLVGFAGTGFAQTGEDEYKIRVDILGVPGEGVGGSIESFQFNSNVSADLGAVTGAQASRTKFSPVVITKGIDSATPKLQTICAGGQRLSRVQISFARSNRLLKNGEQVFLRIVLEDVLVTSATIRLPKAQDAKGALTAGEPEEDVAFSFSRITWIYTLPNGGTIREGWDLRSGREM
ncbi:MAG: type VI secretion system tube protein Hcp [Acidobacteria bacterium]|nr:type VI secretion system tube protein Hcp [Acidobacteriota bacterium]